MNHLPSLHRVFSTVAVLGTAALVTDADAAIVYVDLSATPINIPNTTAGVYLNMITGLTGITSATTVGWDFNPWGSTSGTLLSFFTNATGGTAGSTNNAYIGSGTSVTRLTLGDNIGAGSTFITGVTSGANLFRTTLGIGYVGVRLFNEGNSQAHFGWVAVNVTGTNGFPSSIVGYAYDNVAGNAISAGAVPEPTTLVSLGLLASGALGLRQWRRRNLA